jgi:hypothetical protein
MDKLWPQVVTVEFRPALGKKLFDQMESNVLPLDAFDDWDWSTHVQKDLRAVLGRKVRGRYSRIYCGGPARHPKTRKKRRELRARCRARLLAALRTAAGEAGAKYGSEDTSKWVVQATCEKTSPPTCDQIVPTTAGAIDTPPFPWQNRGTYHQVVGLTGHR